MDLNDVLSSQITCNPKANQSVDAFHTAKYFQDFFTLNEKIPCLFASKNKVKPEND